MKKFFLLLLSIVLIAGLVISCSDEAAEEKEGQTYVEFGSGQSKSLDNRITDNIELSAGTLDNLYWFYSARKVTGSRGKIGQTEALVTTDDNTSTYNSELVTAGKILPVTTSGNVPARGLGGAVGPFSTGKWNFTLYGYSKDSGGTLSENSSLIYIGTASNYTLGTTSYGAALSVPILISYADNSGTVKIDDIKFCDGNDGDMTYRTTLTKIGDSTQSLVLNSTGKETAFKVSPIEITEDNKYALTYLSDDGVRYAVNDYDLESVSVGSYYYDIPIFGTTNPDPDPADKKFTYLKDFNYVTSNVTYPNEKTGTLGTATLKLEAGAYTLKTELLYVEDDTVYPVADLFNTTLLVYPGAVKKITGGMYETGMLPNVRYTPGSVAHVHTYDYLTDEAHDFYFDSLQEALYFAPALDNDGYNYTDILSSVGSDVTIDITKSVRLRSSYPGNGEYLNFNVTNSEGFLARKEYLTGSGSGPEYYVHDYITTESELFDILNSNYETVYLLEGETEIPSYYSVDSNNNNRITLNFNSVTLGVIQDGMSLNGNFNDVENVASFTVEYPANFVWKNAVHDNYFSRGIFDILYNNGSYNCFLYNFDGLIKIQKDSGGAIVGLLIRQTDVNTPIDLTNNSTWTTVKETDTPINNGKYYIYINDLGALLGN